MNGTNQNMPKRKKRKKRKSLMRKFFGIVTSILLVYFLSVGGYIAYTYLNSDPEDNWFDNNAGIIPSSFIPKVPERTNFLLAGVDADGTRTDTIMIGTFNSITKEVSLISIPRDTLVKIPKDRYETMRQNPPEPGSREIKINSIHHYAGEDLGMSFLQKQIEEMFNIKINYYAKVNNEGFRYLVDSIGGIEFDVKERLYYVDPTPGKELYIDLQPGLQVLDGEKAEGLVRFRKGYARQDLDRVEVQQEFMKVFISTALSKDAILSNPTAYLNTIIKYVDTNLKITDSIKYIKYLNDFNSSNFKSYTLPGNPKNINGASYFILDESEAEQLINDVFKSSSSGTTEEQVKSESSKDKNIQILNGGYTTGLAGKTRTKLEEEGFTISDIGDYSGDKPENTIIYVSKSNYGQDLLEYFPEAEIVEDTNETGNYDIVIVLGKNEK